MECEEVTDELRALITGITGFAGSHLADYLLTRPDTEVCGVGLPTDGTQNVDHILSRITLRLADLSDYHSALTLVDAIKPDHVFHLAAQASVGRSWESPAETLVNNSVAQVNLFQAVIEVGLKPRILVVGSADEYGMVRPEDLPVDEDTPLRPLNPYAVSKVTQDYLGLQYHLSHGLHVVRVRAFNHIGPRQGLGFVVPDFAKQVADSEAGLQEPIVRVGNLTAQRDFSDVRDIVCGYYLVLTKGTAGQVYNLGSSRAVSIREILDKLLEMSRVSVRVEADESRMRPSDIPIIVCDNRRVRKDTGWKPRYPLEQSLRDVLEYWRRRAQQATSWNSAAWL